MSKRRLFGKYDLFILGALIILPVIIIIGYSSGYLNGKKGAVCEIKINGKIAHIINLSEQEHEFELPENPHIKFKIKDNAVAFISSDCPDKICVNTGWLRYAGQSAACMPNRVSIHISGNNGVDIVIN